MNPVGNVGRQEVNDIKSLNLVGSYKIRFEGGDVC